MSPATVIPLIWVGTVVLSVAVQLRKIRSKGLTLRQAFQKAAEEAAQKRQVPVKQSASGVAIFGLIGAASIGIAVFLVCSTASFMQHAARAPGQIIDFEARRGSKGGVSYAPRVRFQVPSGIPVIFASRISTSQSWWPPTGATVQVLYDPARPDHARIDYFVDLWFMPLILFLFGDLFLGVSIYMSKVIKKKQEKLQPPTSPTTPLSSPGYNFPPIIR